MGQGICCHRTQKSWGAEYCLFLSTDNRTGIFRRVNLVIANEWLKGGCEKDSQALFSSVPQSYKRQWSQTEIHKILLKPENQFLTVRVWELLNSLSSGVVEPPSLAILKSWLDMALTNWYIGAEYIAFDFGFM